MSIKTDAPQEKFKTHYVGSAGKTSPITRYTRNIASLGFLVEHTEGDLMKSDDVLFYIDSVKRTLRETHEKDVAANLAACQVIIDDVRAGLERSNKVYWATVAVAFVVNIGLYIITG